MTFNDLISLYENKKKKFCVRTYRYITEIFKEARDIHKIYTIKRGLSDADQAWRAFKGKNLEKLIEYIIKDNVKNLGLEIINGNSLERTTKLSKEMDILKRKLCVDYGEFGMHLPDVDMVIYKPAEVTEHIKVFCITLDEDKTLSIKQPTKKGRAICELDTDGCYILSNENIESSSNVKLFSEFIKDLKHIMANETNDMQA